MLRSFKVMGGVAFVALLLLMAGWFATRTGRAVDVSITFVGYTNTGWAPVNVVLAITNQSRVAVSRSTKIWLVEDVRTGQQINCYDAVVGMPVPMPAYEELEPGESRLTFVPLPTNQAPWRAVMWYGPVNWKLRLAKWKAGSLPGWDFLDRLPTPDIDRQEFRSDVITPEVQTTEP